MNLRKIQEIVTIAVSAAFVAFGIWGFRSPVPEDKLQQFFALLFEIILLITGGAAALRAAFGYELQGIIDDFPKIIDTVKLAITTAYAVLKVLEIVVPIPQDIVLQLVALLALVIGGFLGVPAAARLLTGKELQLRKAA